MTPLVKRLRDIAIILAVTAAIAFLMILSGTSLTSTRTSVMRSFSVWIGFITRPDIVVTTLLTIAVTMGLYAYQAAPRR